jgi:hypothetical protein
MVPRRHENLIATGFLACARYSSNEEDKAMQRNDVLVDVVNATASAFLGLTMACAQCHDHKFDPITQRDYYRFEGFFVRGQLNDLLLTDATPSWTRIESYELAFRMQTAAPEAFDLTRETAATKRLYGIERPESRAYGTSCLLTRRLVERGVRFVQLNQGGWDAHGNLRGNHSEFARKTDRPIAGLLADLKRCGLLEPTLVVWGGEFGRTPTAEGKGPSPGRDHNPAAYTMWLAGGGVKDGPVIGVTDEVGYTAIERPVHPNDLPATILHALGIDQRELYFEHNGRRELVAFNGGHVVREAFA